MSFRTKSFFFSDLLPESHLSKCPIVPSMTLSATQIDKFCQFTSFPLSPEPPARRPKSTFTPSTLGHFLERPPEAFLASYFGGNSSTPQFHRRDAECAEKSFVRLDAGQANFQPQTAPPFRVSSRVWFFSAHSASRPRNVSAASEVSSPLQQQTRHVVVLRSIPHERVQFRQQAA